MGRRIYRLIIKEFLAMMRDAKSRSLLIIPPVMQLLVYSYAATHEIRNVSIGIYDEDRSRASGRLVSRIRAVPRTFSELHFYTSPEDVRRALDRQEILAVVHIGQDFQHRIMRGRPVRVQVLLDGRESNAAMIVSGYLYRIIDEFEKSLPRSRSMPAPRIRLQPRMWFNANLNATWSTVAALVAILINLVVLLITALSIARERELGTFEQLLVSPLRPWEIFVGKSVPAVIMGFVEGLFMTGMVLWLFHLPMTQRAFWLLMGVTALFVVSTVAVGLFISSLTRTQQQGFLGAFTYMVPAIILCGFATPVENIPDWLRWVAYINPLQYMVSLSRMLFMEDPSPRVVWSVAWPLVPMGIVAMAAAVFMFRRKLA